MKCTILLKPAMMALLFAMLGACASVPMAPPEQDAASKTFAPPPAGRSGLYVFRNSFVGKALKKAVYLDGRMIGETANAVFFHRYIPPGNHALSTESEFSNNSLTFTAQEGRNHFFRQYIKMGLFVGGANLEPVSEEEGKEEVLQCSEALGVGPIDMGNQGSPPPIGP